MNCGDMRGRGGKWGIDRKEEERVEEDKEWAESCTPLLEYLGFSLGE
jgi:hypothetical protein